jgi:ABC-2 type transport system permease protein
MVNAFRYGMLGVSDINVVAAFAGLLICLAILFMVGLHLLRVGKRLRA